MNTAKLSQIFILVAIPLALLYHSAALEVTSAARVAAAIRSLQLHDTELNRDVLLVRTGSLLHYDSLNRAMAACRLALLEVQSHIHHPPLKPLISVLNGLLREKSQRLEDYKSRIALLRNSLSYFLKLQEALANQAGKSAIAADAVGAAMLRFIRHPHTRHRQALEIHLRKLEALGRQPAITHLIAHSQLIIKVLPQLEENLNQLLAIPVDKIALKLENQHQSLLAGLEQRAGLFRLALFLAAAGFFIGLLVLQTRLYRSLQQLRRAQRHLQDEMQQRLAAEREKNRLERQVLQAQKMEALGTFASGIAHDFNNLLGALRGYGEMAEEDLAPGHPANQSLRQIQSIIAQGQTLVERLLNFARPQKSRHQPQDIAAIAQETLALLHPLIPPGIQVHLENRLPARARVPGDASQLQQMLMNLCQNAIHAMGKEGTLTINLQFTSPDTIEILVADNGCGIPPQHLPLIFEPFFSSRVKQGGTGLGLAMVDRIIRNHHGHIEVESRPGQGTTFKILLPVRSTAVSGNSLQKSETQ